MDQAKMLRRLVEERQKNENGPKIIAITSGKGGVGKTNFTVNLAIAMAMCGKKILIIDADLGMANVDVILGTTPQYNLLNLLDDNLSLEEIMATGPMDKVGLPPTKAYMIMGITLAYKPMTGGKPASMA